MRRDLACWDVAHGGNRRNGEAVLPALIHDKEEKLGRYRKARCDEYWLLIYVDGTAASSFIKLNDSRSIFTSNFEQVFLFSPNAEPESRIIRLNAHKKRVA